MNVAFDLHGVVTYAPEFFSKLSHAWREMELGKIYVITGLVHSRQQTIEDCAKHNIVYDDIIQSKQDTDDPTDRGRLLQQYNISVMFDDKSEQSVHFPPECLTLHVRQPGNFDFVNKKWLYDRIYG
jgi:hypothetical protein